jgi:hypothetical protein
VALRPGISRAVRALQELGRGPRERPDDLPNLSVGAPADVLRDRLPQHFVREKFQVRISCKAEGRD